MLVFGFEQTCISYFYRLITVVFCVAEVGVRHGTSTVLT